MSRAALLVPLIGLVVSCAPRRATCDATCGEPAFACVAGECLRDGRRLEVGALDKFGQLQARRLLFLPVATAVLRPGEARGEAPPVAVLGRAGEASSLLLLRFDVDLPPGTTVVEARLLLDRAPAVDVDPTPVVLHAARIREPWDPRSVGWGRAPHVEEADGPRVTVTSARHTVRVDVRSLVRRWRLHAADDQGIALVADQASSSGVGFALADGAGAADEAASLPTVHAPGPPAFLGSTEGAADSPLELAPPRGPRLELYVKP